MVSIVTIAGKQFCVEPGSVITVPFLQAEPGTMLDLTDELAGTKLTAEVLNHGKDDKIMVRKFRNKTRYQRTNGHRQDFTKVKIAEGKSAK